jgi:hypothetical protein
MVKILMRLPVVFEQISKPATAHRVHIRIRDQSNVVGRIAHSR